MHAIDIKIINLMVLYKTNKEISRDLDIPLSTIQRRVRNLIAARFVVSNIEINYEMFGFKTGLVHVYLRNGNIEETAKKMQNLNQITDVEIHIGNSDILGNVIYKEGKELLNLIATIKKMPGVDKIIWSERVYQSPPKGNESMTYILNSQIDR
jgi:DNA-binding Lrp family transcriptional regulator